VEREIRKEEQLMPSNSTLLGAAGEHHVLSELLRRGYIAALAPLGVPNADIVVTDMEGTRLSAVQVKSRRDIGSDKGWHMKAKHEQLIGDSLFYCFVDFGRDLDDLTVTYVIPSKVVATVLKESHQCWLKTPGKQGQAHKDTVMRRFLPDYTRVFGAGHPSYGPGWITSYKGAWHLLGEPAKPAVEDEIADPA
jgi:hypothetical protein